MGKVNPWNEADLPVYGVRPVAVMESPHRYHHDAPRQPGAAPPPTRLQDRSGDLASDPAAESAGESLGEPAGGIIRVVHGLQNLMADLEGFSHVWVVFWCHHAEGWNDKVVPPRDTVLRGLFATRAPHRPNPLGISVLAVRRIHRREIHVGAHDLLDGSPILDIKPYVPAYDSVPEATNGWVAGVADDARDHRHWWEDRGRERPR